MCILLYWVEYKALEKKSCSLLSCTWGVPDVGELFHRLQKFSIRGCLELLNRTARAIAGHLKEDLSQCIRQINTHLRRQCPGLRSFGVFQLREVFFFKTKFYLTIHKSILLFFKRLFDFNKAVI